MAKKPNFSEEIEYKFFTQTIEVGGVLNTVCLDAQNSTEANVEVEAMKLRGRLINPDGKVLYLAVEKGTKRPLTTWELLEYEKNKTLGDRKLDSLKVKSSEPPRATLTVNLDGNCTICKRPPSEHGPVVDNVVMCPLPGVVVIKGMKFEHGVPDTQ